MQPILDRSQSVSAFRCTLGRRERSLIGHAERDARLQARAPSHPEMNGAQCKVIGGERAHVRDATAFGTNPRSRRSDLPQGVHPMADNDSDNSIQSDTKEGLEKQIAQMQSE